MPTAPARFLYLVQWLYDRRLITGVLATRLRAKITQFKQEHDRDAKARQKKVIDDWGTLMEGYRILKLHSNTAQNVPASTKNEIKTILVTAIEAERQAKEEAEEIANIHIVATIYDDAFDMPTYRYTLQGARTLRGLYSVLERERARLATAHGVQQMQMIVRYMNLRTGKPKYVTIDTDHTDTFARCARWLERIKLGDMEGSGALPDDTFEIDLTYLGTRIRRAGGEGICKKVLFANVKKEAKKKNKKRSKTKKCKKIGKKKSPNKSDKENDKYCLSKCLQEYGIKTEGNPTKIDFDLNLKLRNENVLLEIYADFPDIKKEILTYTKDDDKIEINDKYYKRIKYDNLCVIAKHGDVDTPTKIIKLLNKNYHFMIIESMKDNIYLRLSTCEFCEFKNGEMSPIMKRPEIVKQAIEYAIRPHIKLDDDLYNFDFETVFNPSFNNEIRPYCVFFDVATWTNGGYKDAQCIDINKNVVPRRGLFFGADCAKLLVENMQKGQAKKAITINGFNNCHFDNWLLVNEIANADWLDDIFYNKNMILNIKFGGRHQAFDISRYTPAMSLKDACEGFKCENCKIGGFEHQVIQEAFNKDSNLNHYFHNETCKYYNETKTYFIEDKNICECEKFKTLYEYNKYDVLSTRELYEKIDKMFLDENVIIRERDVKETLQSYEESKKEYDEIIKRIKEDDKLSDDDKACEIYDADRWLEYMTEHAGETITTTVNKGCYEKLSDIKTIGATIYKQFTQSLRKNEIELPLLELEDYNKIRSGLVAGRTQCYLNNEWFETVNGRPVRKRDRFTDMTGITENSTIGTGTGKIKRIKHRDIFSDMTGNNKYAMVDVVSLYPYVMLNRNYPCGDKINITYDECNKRGLIGFYETTFNQSNLKHKILPYRDDDKCLDWTYSEDMTMFISTVDIAQLIKYGCKCEVKNGFAFSEIIDGKTLFECVLKWKNIKEEQDRLKNSGDPKFNPALRQMAKIMLNSLSGKVIEGLHCEQIKYIKSLAEFRKFDENKDVEIIQMLGEDKGLIKYKKTQDEAIKRGNRPIYLGVLIYAYARAHMYDNVISKYSIIYQDTDSAVIPLNELDTMKQSGLIGADFGKFTIEDKEFIRDDDGELISKKEFDELQKIGKRSKDKREVIKKYIIDKIITIAPKNYFMFMSDDGKDYIFKQGFKGINMLKDKLICKADLEAKFIFDKKRYKLPNDYKEHFNFYEKIFNDGCMKKTENIKQLIAILTNKDVVSRKAYILTSSIEKNKYDKDAKNAGLYQRYILKEIN